MRGPRFFLALGFGIIVLCFLGVILFTQYWVRSIEVPSRKISEDAAPSIQRLTDANLAIADMSQRLTDYALGDEVRTPEQFDAIWASRRALERHVGAYLVLPQTPEERQGWARIHSLREQLTPAIRSVIKKADENKGAALFELRSRFRPIVDELRVSLLKTIEFNADKSVAAVKRIDSARYTASFFGLVFTAVVILISIGAAFLVGYSVFSYTRLIEAHNRLLTDQTQELEAFSGRVAHDLRNPLSVFSLVLDSLQRDSNLSDAQNKHISRARSSVVTSERIIDALLKFARAGAKPQKEETTQVLHLVNNTLELFKLRAEKANVQMSASEVHDCRIRASEGVVESVLSNLIDNALKAVADQPTPKIRLRTVLQRDFCRIEIEDSGAGLLPGSEEWIFKPFVRGADRGSAGLGLGLATVKKLVEAHGGRVGVRSTPGNGTVFWFELPRADGS